MLKDLFLRQKNYLKCIFHVYHITTSLKTTLGVGVEVL